MTRQNVVVKTDSFRWLDIVNPLKAALEKIANEYNLHPSLVQDCLHPEQHPKVQALGKTGFFILRAYDEARAPEADTVQEITRKIAVFYTDEFLITIHRKDQPFFVAIRDKWQQISAYLPQKPASEILLDIVQAVFSSYATPVERALNELEQLEMGVFAAQGAQPFQIEQGYYLKRRAFVFRRMLRSQMELLPRILTAENQVAGQRIREEAEGLYFNTDELTESINTLLNLHISLASQKTNEASHRINEVVRVLTIFSVFLLPLNVLTGIYGMNFNHMPELSWHYGYPAVLIAMIAVEAVVYFWFRKRGWLL